MKKFFIITSVLLCALAACSKGGDPGDPGKDDPGDPSRPSGKDVTVTLTADGSFDADFKAKAYLSLSEANTVDVTVRLGNATPEEGKVRVPADFDKEVTIPAGKTNVEVPLKADVMGLREGDYQFALKISSAKNASVGNPSVAYVGMHYNFMPEVNLFADQKFSSSCEATLTASIAKAHTMDVVVKLEVDPDSKASVSFDKTLTIPAGETSAKAIVKVTVPENLAAGSYPVIIRIASVENGRPGTASAATINLNYPFSSTITVDGMFEDWAGALEWVTPPDATFQGIRTIKLAATSKTLYVYFEIVEPSPDNFDAYPMPIDIFLDSDGNYSTGGKLASIDNPNQTPPFLNSGLSWYIEMANVHLGQDYIDFTYGAYKYIGKDGDGIFSGLDNQTGKYTSDEMFGVGVLGEDGVGRIEIRIDRKYFEITGLKAMVGIKVMNGNNDWNCYGLAPTGNFAKGKVDMALINLPEYDES